MKPILLLTLILMSLSLAGGVDAKQKGCPPGLAKKHNGCTPPGLAKGYGDDDDDEGHYYYGRGDWVGDQDYHRITYPDRYGLPPLPNGQRYIILGNQIMVVDEGTYDVLTIIGAAQAILD